MTARRKRNLCLQSLAIAAPALAAAFLPSAVSAHPSEQGFVLLLPTDLYISAGIATVALTAAALAALPASISGNLFATREFRAFSPPAWCADASSVGSAVFLAALTITGFTGSGDPLSNPLPLVIWTLWWILLLCLQGVVGDIWSWVNPWTGICNLLTGRAAQGPLRLPPVLGGSVGAVGLVLFSGFALADPAPDYPPRLAAVTAGYWLFTLAGMCIFGRDEWLSRCECLTMLFRLFTLAAPIRLQGGRGRIGLPGWQITPTRRRGLAVFMLTALAAGSFDGLNETFWWLDLIGVNPLEFPGRSAVAAETVGGMLAAVLLLHAVFALCVFGGQLSARLSAGAAPAPPFRTAFSRLAISVLPIALGYHVAHYLPAFLVNSQYLAAAASDPLTTGADLLGLGAYYVTTGFFYNQESVRVILLTQCAAIVAGHVVAVLAAHAAALDLYGSNRRASLSQAPMAVFMVLYTLLSLWLLASPRGA